VHTGTCSPPPGHNRDRPVHGPHRPGQESTGDKNAPWAFVIVDNGSDQRRPGRDNAAEGRLAERRHYPHHGPRKKSYCPSHRRKSSRPATSPTGRNSLAPTRVRGPLQPRRPSCSTPQTWPCSSRGSAPMNTLPETLLTTGGNLTTYNKLPLSSTS
jgi:hypothetical protein